MGGTREDPDLASGALCCSDCLHLALPSRGKALPSLQEHTHKLNRELIQPSFLFYLKDPKVFSTIFYPLRLFCSWGSPTLGGLYEVNSLWYEGFLLFSNVGLEFIRLGNRPFRPLRASWNWSSLGPHPGGL